MKRKICGLIIAIGFFVCIGIIGGIDYSNEPLINALWILPTMIVMWVSAKIGGFFNY